MPKMFCDWLEGHNFSCDHFNHQALNGETALMYASRYGKAEYVIELIDWGANFRLITLDDFSAFDVAATPKILRWLKQVNKGLSKSQSNYLTSLVS